MWRLHEQVLAVEEVGVSSQGTILVEVVHCVLEEYDLTQKVKNILSFFFNGKSINMKLFIFLVFTTTKDNSSNNKTMTESLENLLSEWIDIHQEIPCAMYGPCSLPSCSRRLERVG